MENNFIGEKIPREREKKRKKSFQEGKKIRGNKEMKKKIRKKNKIKYLLLAVPIETVAAIAR